MKKHALIAVCAVGIFAMAPAQSTHTLVSFRDGSASQVVATPKLTLHDVLDHKGLDVDVWAFGGVQLTPGQPLTGGLAVSFRQNLSREAFADVGLYARAVQAGKTDAGLFFGIGWKL